VHYTGWAEGASKKLEKELTVAENPIKRGEASPKPMFTQFGTSGCLTSIVYCADSDVDRLRDFCLTLACVSAKCHVDKSV
jgi:hypothetical protein